MWYNVILYLLEEGDNLFSGERIKKLREEHSVSQIDLAKALFISQSSISEYESGNQQPPTSMLIQLADFFDVNIDYLLGRTDIKISLNKLMQKLSTDSGSVTINDFLQLKDDEKRVIGELIKSFNKYNSGALSQIKKRK